MSSMDSSLLSGASILTHNLYSQVFLGDSYFSSPSEDNNRTRRKFLQPVTVLRISTIFLGIISVILSMLTQSVYDLWILAGDLGYVIVFPHFLAAVHFPHLVNRNGAIVASLVGTFFRLSIGEKLFGLTPIIEFPPEIPIKSSIMCATLFSLLLSSKLTKRY